MSDSFDTIRNIVTGNFRCTSNERLLGVALLKLADENDSYRIRLAALELDRDAHSVRLNAINVRIDQVIDILEKVGDVVTAFQQTFKWIDQRFGKLDSQLDAVSTEPERQL